ncbi:hypothetical protein RD792_004694 [Penstemon davidsonii]|uniref:Uncharacterized protein n=1 Tax=Penstemon davidsonii TaxID=160366 RepID=A0ABR0DI46_9LAMI|nr:hypothetical protein RD792_004694 [Penstemon davidsonii]
MDQEEELPLEEKQCHKERAQKHGFLGVILGPFYWLKKLSEELHWSFVLGVVVVYGINQGLSMGLSKIQFPLLDIEGDLISSLLPKIFIKPEMKMEKLGSDMARDTDEFRGRIEKESLLVQGVKCANA